MPLEIRIAEKVDLSAIAAIHDQAIALPYANAYTEPFNTEERLAWFEEHDTGCPIYVAIVNDEIAGWLSVSPYRSGRAALAHTREVSYYVHEKHQKKGVATQLLKHAIDKMQQLGAKVYIAIVIDKNTPSVKLLEKNGFRLWGHLPNTVFVNNETCGHYYFGLHSR